LAEKMDKEGPLSEENELVQTSRRPRCPSKARVKVNNTTKNVILGAVF